MKLYNTLTKKIETIKPLNPPEVKIYICGPTVYDYAHLGHARTYINSDVLVRALKFFDYQPKVVMNITDVGHLTDDADQGEDKMEKKARQEKKDIWKVAQHYTDDFWQMAKSLNIQKPDVVCRATDYVPQMIKLVKALEEKGYTYKTSDGIYFDTSKLDDYGKLANVDLKQLKEGARVDKNTEKKNPTDFALWKFSKESEKRQMEWQSPWAKKSFPGWHIECSAMSMAQLGEQLDIHTGGVDHINVHHTNEIAQSEAVTGKKPFSKYWFHSEWLLIEGEKMSKSKKNFYCLQDVVDRGFSPLAVRYLFLQSHYRSSANFTWKGVESAQKAYDKLKEYMKSLNRSRRSLSQERMGRVSEYSARFDQYLADDLKLPQVIALVWEVVKSSLPNQDKRDLLLDWDQVLGLSLGQAMAKEPEVVPGKIKDLAQKRQELREQKKWQEADKVREEIENLGYVVEDTSQGFKIRKEAEFKK